MVASMDRTPEALLDDHRSAGHVVDVDGVATFVRRQGAGPAVVLVHGVPVSSWVWRNVLPELASRGLEGIAPDLPGTGLSGRPEDFDYSWTGLGAHIVSTVDALGLDEFHLVVHDIGGPVGFEVTARMPDRVRSMTVLNTITDPASFTKPAPMRPFEYRGIGELWLRSTPRPAFRLMIRRIGLAPGSAVTNAEIDVHHLLLRRDDGGTAFLKIMRSFETTQAKSDLYREVLSADRPKQLLWGERDPALRLARHGAVAANRMGLAEAERLPGRHFVQEDCGAQIADRIAQIALR
jgi:haloalkane dehalogenase